MKIGPLLSISLSLIASMSYANNVTILNPDMDSQILNDGVFIPGSTLGWQSIRGSNGIYNPPESVLLGEGGNGGHTNTLYLNAGSLVSQTLSASLEASSSYSLSFDIADRFDTQLPNYVVRIKAGGSTVFESINPVVPITDGTFDSVQLNFESGSNNGVGSPIVIELEAIGTGQINFDNFALSFVASNTQESVFGEWKHTDLGDNLSINTTYFAETDGFITYRNDVNCSGNVDVIKLGENQSNLNIRTTRADGFSGMTSPVKRGMYWRIERASSGGNCPVRIGFLPLLP